MVAEKKTAAKKASPSPAKRAAPAKAPVAPKVPMELKPAIQRRRTAVGVVVSNKMQKTIVVRVDRKVHHAFYKKYITRSNKFKAHDEKNDAKPGDLVSIVETRPLSKDKRWALQSILRKAPQTLEVNV